MKPKGKSASVNDVIKSIDSLTKRDRHKLIGKLLDIEEFREDLLDIALIESRKGEDLRPFRDYLKERGIKR